MSMHRGPGAQLINPKKAPSRKIWTVDQLRNEMLSDYKTCLHYLCSASEDADYANFMEAFAHVVAAQGGVGKFAKKTRLSRQSIYNAINNKSLRADSFFEIIRGLGLRLSLLEAELAPRCGGQRKLLGPKKISKARRAEAMRNGTKSPKIASVEQIARLADQGRDISRHFTNNGKMMPAVKGRSRKRPR